MRFSLQLTRYIVPVIAASTVIFSTQTFAGAFQLWEQDSNGIGDYHAGAAAEADTAATEFYNPAGMTRIKHQQVSFGGALISLDLNYTGTATDVFGSTFSVSNIAGDTVNIVPNFHYVLPFSNHWAFGFGVTSPFGLATNYPDEHPSNILATKTKLETINLNPSIAYDVNRYLSVGVGLDVLYGQAIYNTNPIPPYLIRCDLSGWNYGYNAGLLLQFTPTTRAGLSYRSAITIPGKGSSSSTNLSTGLPVSGPTTANFPLPATTIFSLYHDVNSRFTVMGSAFYTQWSVFKELVINNIQTPQGVGTIALNQNYRNTWNFAVGGKYELVHHIWLDAGFGHDDTPTRLGYRDIRLPDNSHYAASLGLDIKPSDRLMWSMGWTHFFIPTTPIDDSLSNNASKTTPTFEPGTGIGTERGEIDVMGIQFTCDID